MHDAPRSSPQSPHATEKRRPDDASRHRQGEAERKRRGRGVDEKKSRSSNIGKRQAQRTSPIGNISAKGRPRVYFSIQMRHTLLRTPDIPR